MAANLIICETFKPLLFHIGKIGESFTKSYFVYFFKYTKNLLQKNPDENRDSSINTNLDIFLDSLRA
jgi:hypothetical protein